MQKTQGLSYEEIRKTILEKIPSEIGITRIEFEGPSTGEIINAAEALRIGLIHRIVSRSGLIPSVESMARLIMSRGQVAVRYAKEAINRGLDMSLDAGLEMESELFAMVLSTDKVQDEN